MDTNKKIDRALSDLSKKTGISFAITDSSLEDELLLKKLKDMITLCEGHDNRDYFFQQCILGQLSSDEIKEGISHFHIDSATYRVLFLIHFKVPYDDVALSILNSLYDPSTTVIIEMDPCHIIFSHQVKKAVSDSEIGEMAKSIADTLSAEAMLSVRVSYDKICDNLFQLASIYQELVVAMQIGQIFYASQSIYGFHDLGLGKLIYQVPREACISYLEDNLSQVDFRGLDAETMNTIHAFFESGLNIAEAARKLFLHRNTLVYRLDKFQKQTGLDIRMFDDAVTCRIGMMLADCLDVKPSSEA